MKRDLGTPQSKPTVQKL